MRLDPSPPHSQQLSSPLGWWRGERELVTVRPGAFVILPIAFQSGLQAKPLSPCEFWGQTELYRAPSVTLVTCRISPCSPVVLTLCCLRSSCV